MQSYSQYRTLRREVEGYQSRAKARLRVAQSGADEEKNDTRDSNLTTDLERGQGQDQAGSTAYDINPNQPIGSNWQHVRHHDGAESSEEAKEEEEKPDNSQDESDAHSEDDVDPELRETLNRSSSHRSTGTALGQAMTGINLRKRKTNEGGDGQVFIVGYHDDRDSANPHNWTYARRIWVTMMIAAIGFVVGMASSIDSIAVTQAAEEFGVSEVVEILATGLFLVGFGVGALFAGPFSETVGRNPVYIVTMLLFMIFIMASALAPNIGAQLVFRSLAGFFGATPLVCAGGSLSDIWSPYERVYAFPIFANAAFAGPVLGPVIGGFISQPQSRLPAPQWRWCEWITLIMAGLILVLVVLFVPETFSPVLLKWKAAHLRDITGDDRYRAEVEVRQETFMQRLGHALYRPFLLTVREPIIILLSLYLTVIYIVLFTFLDGYTYIFKDIHGISQGMTGLCFLGIFVGLCLASVLVPIVGKMAKTQLHKIKEQGGTKLPPEFRLYYAMFGAPAIPISLFWMGWTSYSSISIWSPLAASALFGYGILCVFISTYQYIIDSYETYAASALASLTLIRYVASGGMTVVGIPFYSNVGVHWTLTILGIISLLCLPIPYLFYKYGPWIRQKSKYAPTD